MVRLLPPVPLAWRIRARVHNGVIAGGCLRDLVLGRAPKDVDIIVAVSEGFTATRGFYQIIRKPFGSVAELLDGFDIGLCQIAYHPDDGYTCTEAFWRDVENRTLTLFQRCPEHLRRMMEKFPDYTLVDNGHVPTSPPTYRSI